MNYWHILVLGVYVIHGLTEEEQKINEDPTRYRKLVEAYVDETMRPLDPLGVHEGELTYVKQVWRGVDTIDV